MTVLSTTRSASDRHADRIGVDHVLLDDGDVAAQVRAPSSPTASTPRSSWSARPRCPTPCAPPGVHGIVCFTGMLSNVWTVKDFYPIGYLPREYA